MHIWTGSLWPLYWERTVWRVGDKKRATSYKAICNNLSNKITWMQFWMYFQGMICWQIRCGTWERSQGWLQHFWSEQLKEWSCNLRRWKNSNRGKVDVEFRLGLMPAWYICSHIKVEVLSSWRHMLCVWNGENWARITDVGVVGIEMVFKTTGLD